MMADIAQALQQLAKAILDFGNNDRYAKILPAQAVTPATTEGNILASYAPTGLKMYYISLKVRSMGTATYIAVGAHGATEERLTVVGEIYEAEAPRAAFLNTKDLMIMADVADAVVEVGGVIIPRGEE